jgi:hypothetical protein
MATLKASACRLMLTILTTTTTLPGFAVAQDAGELRQLIELQRQQLEQQARQLEQMERRLQELEAGSAAKQEATEDAQRRAAELEEVPMMRSGGTGVQLKLSGQINRAIMTADDGDKTKVYNVDNNNSSSRLRVVGSARPTEAVRVGTTFEFEMRSNSSVEVSQSNEDTGTVGFRDRVIELFAEHEDFGRVSLGQGSTAYDNVAEQDLSGTGVIGYSAVNELAGGLRFFDDDAGALSNTTIGNAFNNFDGGRLDRVRYDTPRFAGFTAAVDYAADQRWSTALRWAGKASGFSAAAAISYADPGGDRDWVVAGSGSVLHEASGFSLTLASGARDNDGRDDAVNYYAKLGWQSDLFSFGRTFTAIDFNRVEDVNAENDEGTSVGVFAVQGIKDFGIEAYAGYRWHELDRDGADFNDIHVFSVGSRVRF